jgi:hypothetical protein
MRMNDLLQRLVDRARTPGATVEPLYTPRYGAAGSHQAGFESMDAGVSNDAAPTLNTITTAPENISAGSRARSSAAPSKMGNTKTVPANVARIRSSSEPGPDTSPAFDRQGSSGLLSEHYPAETASKYFQIIPTQETSDSDRNTAHEQASDTRTHSEAASSAAMFAHRDQPSPRQQPSADVSAPVLHANEITISIGHIEVRSAPMPARPRKAAFRPRVTLDDFLKRKPGGRQ